MALALIALSCAIFPAALWLDWLHCLPRYQAAYFSGGTADPNSIVSLAGNLVALGAPPWPALGLQALLGGVTAVITFLAFRHFPYRLAVAAMLAGMFLCTPHAFAYDTLPLIAAMLLLAPDSPAGIGLCLLTYLAPYLLLTGKSSWFLYAIPESLVFGAIIYLAIGRAQRPNNVHEPVPSAESRYGQF
jgi:hypothetical protein